MKKRLLSFAILAVFSLSSCFRFIPDNTSSYEKEISVYDIDKIDETNQLSSCFQTTVAARFVDEQGCIPYLTIEQYASLCKKHMKENVFNDFVDGSMTTRWTVRIGSSAYFDVIINRFAKTITMGGSLEASYKEDDDPRDLKSLNYALDIDSTGSRVLSGSGYATFSYDGYEINSFMYDGKAYYPLAFFDITFSDATGIYFNYNYKHIFSTRDVDNYAAKRFIDNGAEYTFDEQMSMTVGLSSIPNYLIRFNANLFCYLMDNFYGMKDAKEIQSFASYYRTNNLYNPLFSSNGGNRGQGYSDCLSILDDNHTVLVSVNSSWGEYYTTRRKYGDGTYRRSSLGTELSQYRQNAYSNYQENGEAKPSTSGRDILYSQDGKTALFSFDNFVFGTSEQVFNNDDSVKETAKEYDTYFKIVDVLQTIKNKGGVENIILDVSINGGGVVGIMMKLLALISNNNNGYIAFYEPPTKQLGIYNARIDLNMDGQYNTEDCFGDEFNFYILTSYYSFSCGNAFPCSAQYKGSAKIIGQTSGGGECAVSIHYLPNSEYVYHSSNLHLGTFNNSNETFTGFENGATPDIEIPINQDFYSIENLNSKIQIDQQNSI